MKQMMKAAFLEKPGKLVIDEISLPECGENEVLINIKEIGLCGSDIHYYNEGRIGDHVVRAPHILGHESAGVVVGVGENVKKFTVGERVAIEPGLPCLSCEYCLQGAYNLCNEMRFLGAPPYHGCFREYLSHDYRFVHKMPESLTYSQGALIEPLAVAHNAIKKAKVVPGSTVLIIGAGTIGIACLEMSKVFGASKIFVAEVDSFKIQHAKKLGAHLVINPLEIDLIQAITEQTGGRMCDSVIEASGTKKGIHTALHTLKKGGRIAAIGMGPEVVDTPIIPLLKKEAVVVGVYRYANDFSPVIDLLASGSINTEGWITHTFELDLIKKAMDVATDKGINKLKIVIKTGNSSG